jgi:hypothetical protein
MKIKDDPPAAATEPRERVKMRVDGEPPFGDVENVNLPMLQVTDIEHVVVGGGANLLCLWPRHGGLWTWDNEILAAYVEAPCNYKHPREAAPEPGGVWKRGYVRLRRSRDGGARWDDAGKVFDNSMPFERQRQVLRLDDYRGNAGPERDPIDMAAPDSIMVMSRAWCGDEVKGTKARQPVLYGFRSPDRGRHWETVPSVLWPEASPVLVEVANNVLRLGSARLLGWVVGSEGIEGAEAPGALVPRLYLSEDSGAHWTHYGDVAGGSEAQMAYSYPHIVPLPSGRWLCFMGAWQRNRSSRRGWTALSVSDDGGLNWSQPLRIAVWTHAPFPLRLRNGRLLLLYTRCAPEPVGLYAIASDDEGRRWSQPALLRGDTLSAGPRGEIPGAYPVAAETADGRIFAAYCWQHDDEDVPWHGGRSFIGGTFFRLR